MSFGTETSDGTNAIFVNFNQDVTSLAVGTKTGYKLYVLNSTDKLELIHEDGTEDICIVERLFSSSLVAIVGYSSPRKLKVCHFKKKTEIINYSYPNTILAVKLNRQRLIVCLEESIYIHNIRDMKLLHTIKETPPNPNGLCALSANSDNCLLAYPANQSNGELLIFDAQNLQNKLNIAAHDNPLAAIAFDSTGLKIATASEKGTVIRVFNVLTAQCIYEFRRGYARCVSIYSLSFSADSLFLCASSNTETVHIFKLEDLTEECQEEPQGWMGMLSTYGKKALAQSASYWPSVADMINQWRSFATARLPIFGPKNVCAITSIQKMTRVLIASSDGCLFIYDLNLNEGGECNLIKQHRLGETVNVSGQSTGAEGHGTMNYAAAVRGCDPPGAVSTASALSPSFPTSDSSNASPRSETAPNYEGEFPPIGHS